jgi:mRNA interferase MazF
MVNPDPGEVWLVDLGLAAKTRPCLVLSVPATGSNDHVLDSGC